MPQTYTCVPAGVPPTTYTNNTQAGTPVLNYDIGFPYIQTTDILVFTGEEGNWTQRNQGTGADQYQINPQGGLATDEVVFNNGVGGANIMIWRRTDLCNMGRTFTAGSSIRAEDLNQDFTQLLYVLQEAGSLIDGIVDGGVGGGGLPLPGDQLDLDDLGDVDITSGEDRNWLYFDGTNWVNGDVITSTDTWAASDTQIATTSAINARINTGGGAGGFHSHLIWSGTGTTREARQFQDTADGNPLNIADTEIVTVNGADVLRITFTTGVFTVTATGPANLRWDQKCDEFTVTVQNPVGEANFIDEIISPLTAATRFDTDLTNYTTTGVDNAFAAGVTSTQVFNVPTADNLITPGTTATDGVDGGDATATVTFRLVDDTVSTDTAVCNIDWPDAGSNLTAGTGMTGNTFLERYNTCQIVVATQNLATPGNASHTLTSSDADDDFENTDGTALTQPFTGNATVQVDWDDPIAWDTTTIPTITCTTDYTRPAAVTGTEYTVQDQTETLTPTANFTFPSLAQFRNSRNAADAPNQASLIDGTGFETGVIELGNEAVTFDQTVNNTTGGITGFWFCVRETATNQPNRARIFIQGVGLTETDMTTVNNVALRDDGNNVTAVDYTCYGITLQNGFNARVVFDRN